MITRFAPSPTGPLHLGHAYSAILAHDMAMAAGGRFLLRIEDIDQSRARPAWEEQIYDDLAWLGLTWDRPVMRQSQRAAAYEAALRALHASGLIYPCYCNRRDIQAAMSAPQEGAPLPVGPDGLIYPGTCARLQAQIPRAAFDADNVYRLATAQALGQFGTSEGGAVHMQFYETGDNAALHPKTVVFTQDQVAADIGDVVVARKDMGTSYHLSVVVDDAAQGVTDVVRGRDLFEATKIHVVLQRALGLQTPTYHHHRLIRDDAGQRLAKRDDARALSKYRADGATPADIRRLVGLP